MRAAAAILALTAMGVAVTLGAPGLGGDAEAQSAKSRPLPGVWKGLRLEGGSDLRLRVARDSAQIGTVRASVLQTCLKGEPMTTTAVQSPGGFEIRRGRFAGTKAERLGKVRMRVSIAGQFTSRRRASGVLRVRTTVGGTECDSGRLPFVAAHARR